MVSDRQHKILDALIGEYVYTAAPVGSSTLVRRYSLGVSPATVRSELASLEDGGFVVSPHVSAGRIPTDAGYRVSVDSLLKRGEDEDFPAGRDMAKRAQGAEDLDELVSGLSEALARLTHCLAVIAAPAAVKKRPKRISIVPLGPRSCVLVVVTQDGTVLNRRIALSSPAAPEELAAVESRLNEVFNGPLSAEVRKLAETDPARLSRRIGADELTERLLVEVAACLANLPIYGETHRYGLADLLGQPEFASNGAAAPLARLLEDNSSLLRLFSGMGTSEGVVVRIGHENGKAAKGMSVVATAYAAWHANGLVALVGPTRMDYPMAISAVRAAAVTLEKALG